MSDTSDPRPLTIAVIGATGAVGGDLLAALHRSALPVGELRLFASPASAGRTIEVEGRDHRVLALPTDLSGGALDGVDLALLATAAEVARRVGPALAEQGVMVVDIGGALADRAPLVVPALGLSALPEAARARLVCSPSAPAVLVSTLLGGLRELAPLSVRGTVLLSAGAAGRAGVEELSGQVVAMFNQKEPPRRVFHAGLAFDLHGVVGQPLAASHGPELAGWTDAERRVADEVAVLAELPASRVALGLVLAPTFSGVSAALQIELEHEASLDEVRQRLEDGRTVRLGDPVPGPRRAVGRASAFVGRLRLDPAGGGLHLWAVADNLRFGATGNALAIATALWRDGLL
ncbi:hypothetical protein L6R53_27155 [Myxococcota bacterium]|nr:hypothetical protein [Myxococcota bacterium]